MRNPMTRSSFIVRGHIAWVRTLTHFLIKPRISLRTRCPDQGRRWGRKRWARRMSVFAAPFQWDSCDDLIILGICAMDYLGNDPNPNPDTPGLIVDDVRPIRTTTCQLTDRFLRSCMKSW